MDDPVRKITKLQILSYIDDFIQNNVKVLENPCYTDIGEYHKLMKKIKSKMIYSHEGCGTKTSKRRKSSVEVSVKDSVLNTIDNSLSEVSCTSDCTSKDMNLSTKNKVVLNCGISKPIVIKEELPEIKTEVFEFNPREHGIYASESFSPTCIEVKSDNSHNIILYELHNDNNLLQIINNDNDTKPDRNMMILQKLLSKNSLNVAVDCGNNNINNSGIKVDTPFIKEDIVLSDYEPAEIKNDDYYNTIIKNEPTQLKVRTDLVQQLQLEQNSSNGIVNMENTAAFIGTDACKSISNKSGSTLSNENSKKQVNILKKVLHKKKYSIFLKSTFTNKPKSKKYTRHCTNKRRKYTELMKKESTEKNEEGITIKNCSVPLVKVEDELLNDYKLKSNLLPRDTNIPMFSKLLLQDMMNISAGKQLTFFSPENLNVLIDKLSQDNINSEEVLLFLNTNDIVTKMYMDHFPQFETAILENKVKVIDKTVAEIYTRVQGINVFFDTYVQQKLSATVINKHFGYFKKNMSYALRVLK